MFKAVSGIYSLFYRELIQLYRYVIVFTWRLGFCPFGEYSFSSAESKNPR